MFNQMTFRQVQFLWIALFIITATGCKKQKIVEGTPIVFQSIKMDESQRIKSNSSSPMLNIQLNYQYPLSYSNLQTLAKVRQQMLHAFLPNLTDTSTDANLCMKADIQNKFNLYERTENFGNKESTTDKWWDKTTLVLRYNDNNLLSYTVETNQFTGGNKTGVNLQNYILDLTTGEKLSESDIFSDDAINLVNEILLKKLKLKNNVQTSEELVQIGYFDVAQIGQYKNLYLTEQGITYTFNALEIGSYDLGTIEITLSFSDLEDLLMADSPISKLYHN